MRKRDRRQNKCQRERERVEKVQGTEEEILFVCIIFRPPFQLFPASAHFSILTSSYLSLFSLSLFSLSLFSLSLFSISSHSHSLLTHSLDLQVHLHNNIKVNIRESFPSFFPPDLPFQTKEESIIHSLSTNNWSQFFPPTSFQVFSIEGISFKS